MFFLNVELHATHSSDWWGLFPNAHLNHFDVRYFVRTLGEHLRCATRLGVYTVSLRQCFHICVWTSTCRLAACFIRLTILQQYTTCTFGCRPWEEACMRWQEKSELIHVVYRLRSCVKLSHCDCLPSCHCSWSSLFEAHNKEWSYTVG